MFKKMRKIYENYIDKEAAKRVAASTIVVENHIKGSEFLDQVTLVEKAVEHYNKGSKMPEDLLKLFEVIYASLNLCTKNLAFTSEDSFTYRLNMDIIKFKMYKKICLTIKNNLQ